MNETQTASLSSVDAAYRVSEQCQAEKINGTLLDLQTARAIITVAEALSAEARAKLDAMPIGRAGTIAWRLIEKTR